MRYASGNIDDLNRIKQQMTMEAITQGTAEHIMHHVMINFILNGEMRFMQFDFTREGDVDILYLFVDKRIQYHDNGTNRHAIPIFMLAYLFENNSSKRQLILSDVFSEIREMKSRVKYERIKLKEPVNLGEITVI